MEESYFSLFGSIHRDKALEISTMTVKVFGSQFPSQKKFGSVSSFSGPVSCIFGEKGPWRSRNFHFGWYNL
jgi:hypothetical protein